MQLHTKTSVKFFFKYWMHVNSIVGIFNLPLIWNKLWTQNKFLFFYLAFLIFKTNQEVLLKKLINYIYNNAKEKLKINTE